MIMPQMQLLRLVKRYCLVFFEDFFFIVANDTQSFIHWKDENLIPLWVLADRFFDEHTLFQRPLS